MSHGATTCRPNTQRVAAFTGEDSGSGYLNWRPAAAGEPRLRQVAPVLAGRTQAAGDLLVLRELSHHLQLREVRLAPVGPPAARGTPPR